MNVSEPDQDFSATLAAEGLRPAQGLCRAALAIAALLITGLEAARRLHLTAYPEMLRSAVPALPLAATLVLLAGLAGTAAVARARLRTALAPEESWRPGLAARLPQALLVPAVALTGALLAWRAQPLPAPILAPSNTAYTLGGGCIALAFLLLVMERTAATVAPLALPEAPSLRALGFLAAATSFGAGLLEIAAGLGLPYTDRAGSLLALVVAATGVELAARAAGRLFLPPPAPQAARGATASMLARLLAGAAQDGLAAPIRQQFGIDFSRSWALSYVRAAFMPMLLGLGLLAWGLSGLVLVPVDARAIYERFGAPVAVLHPGLHLLLPWPMGAARRLDYGAVHEIGLAEAGPAAGPRPGAEDPAPTAADRLWEQAHPGEITLIIASATAGKQSFQSISADIRVLFRIGLTDQDARMAAYAAVAPDALVRAEAGRVVARYVAGRTLDSMLGANREQMAEDMRSAVQRALDAHRTGIRIVAMSVEAIHPPAGAADAYHNVRAAEISAAASIAVERGVAATVQAQSRQSAFAQAASASAGAAERLAAARTQSIRFKADQQAAAAGGRSFLMERYFASLVSALGKAPKTVIDHRLNWPEAPVLDLRPFAAAAAGTGGKEE
jgi:regulator of protease activity HflC (stomatin/prohibitin superfamily)